MILDRVTITGADDSVSPGSLLEISKQFPFVEWGILVSQSKSNTDCPRFPSAQWISELQALDAAGVSMALSLHVCGKWTRDLLQGEMSIPPELLRCFGRIQLNFHADKTPCKPKEFADAAKGLARPIIFQIDGELGNAHLDSFFEHEGDGYPLYDISGGAGVLPKEWPAPRYLRVDPGEHGEGVESYSYHGYAGGLGPDNLERQLPLIALAAAGTEHTHEGPIWIDMETRVRSVDDRHFDLCKVVRCLEIAEPFIARPSVPTA